MVLVGELEGGEGGDIAEEGEGRREAHAFETQNTADFAPGIVLMNALCYRFVPETFRWTIYLYWKPLDGR